MPIASPPWIIDGTTLDAQVIRQALGSLLGAGGGIVTAGDFLVVQNATPNMAVLIAGGRVWIPGTDLAPVANGSNPPWYPQGPYYTESDASFGLAISASDPSNPRIDRVILQVQDAEYVGTLKQCAPAIVIGAPTAGATLANLSGAGAVPPSSLLLANVLVPAGASSIVTADIANVAPYVKPRDSGWMPLTFPAGFAASTPVPQARRIGDEVRLRGIVRNTSAGTLGAGATFATVPVGMFPAQASSAMILAVAAGASVQPGTVDTSGNVKTSPAITMTGTADVVVLDGFTYPLS